MTVTKTMDAPLDVHAAAIELRGMTMADLRRRYAELFGETTRSANRDHLVRRMLWRLQAIREGGLSERARRRALEIARDEDLRVRPPRDRVPDIAGCVAQESSLEVRGEHVPLPGSLIRREYKGKMIVVRVLPRGFEFEGEVFRSLSAIARRVTGAHWNGHHFLGLRKRGGR